LSEQRPCITVLVAEDDPDDRILLKDAMAENGLTSDLRFVEDGEELLDYLQRRGRYTAPASSPRPDLVLLDLNMPRKDGREALEELGQDPELRRIPTVVLTTSNAEEDIERSYALGANSYIAKPVTLEGWAEVMRTLGQYWFQIVELPVSRNGK
jgi:CheY-like chemotaxis protein